MDFGVARLADGAALTAPGDVVGTLAYMSPEQAEGRSAGPEADVYSLALTLYECWSGENPNRRATPAATARAIGARPRSAAPPPPRPAARAQRDDRRLPAAPARTAVPPWRSWAPRSRTRSTASPTSRSALTPPLGLRLGVAAGAAVARRLARGRPRSLPAVEL